MIRVEYCRVKREWLSLIRKVKQNPPLCPIYQGDLLWEDWEIMGILGVVGVLGRLGMQKYFDSLWKSKIFQEVSIGILEKILTFATVDRYAEARSGLSGGMQTLWKAFTRRSFLAFQESGKFIGMVKDEAMVDALWICILTACRYVSIDVCYMTYSAWGFCVARSTIPGITRASEKQNEQQV